MSPALTPKNPNVGFEPRPNSAVLGHVKSADEMDEERKEQIAYEYLCRLEEAKKWIEVILHQELPEVTVFEQNIRNGVVLAKLAAAFAPKIVSERKIFDFDESFDAHFMLCVTLFVQRIFLSNCHGKSFE